MRLGKRFRASSLNSGIYVMAALWAAVGAFLMVADLAEHPRRARLALELSLFVPAALFWLRAYRHFEH